MDLGESGLGVAEAASSEVKEVVALIAQPCEIATLVASLVRGVNGEGLVPLHVLQPPAEVWPEKIAADQITQFRAPDRCRPTVPLPTTAAATQR